jgi:putative restriction endonuclease
VAKGAAGGEDLDSRVRLAAFGFLARERARRGDTLPHDVLLRGFDFDGTRVPLIGPQGIFKPAILPEMPLSIVTAPVIAGRPRPYEDEIAPDGTLVYRYRGTDPFHRDNVGLRRAMERHVPLVYLPGVERGMYYPVWPVFIVGDDPDLLAFRVTLVRPQAGLAGAGLSGEASDLRRYATTEVLRRLHQVGFRHRVLRAYRECCAICRLRHHELLDAAHILPDDHPRGEPIVPNGLALCKLHHAAFDRHILGVRPDLVVEIREDILREHDGPMLVHGLKDFQAQRLMVVPRSEEQRPNRDFLAERYELFRKAS